MKDPLDLTVPTSGTLSVPALEKRAYHADSTPEEIAAIRDRVYIYREGIICLKELPIVSSFSINIVTNQISALARSYQRFGVIIDLSETKRPDAATRRTISKRFSELCKHAAHVSFCLGEDSPLETFINYILFGVDIASYSINLDADCGASSIENIL